MTENIGVDYGLGQSNIDKKTGIRYGVISQRSVSGDALNDLEPDYGLPHCPKCGNEASYTDTLSEESGRSFSWDRAKHEDDEFFCATCKYVFGSESAYPDEAIGLTYDKDGYQIQDCLDSDLMVTKSRFYTFAQFCSPCVPGAGNLDAPISVKRIPNSGDSAAGNLDMPCADGPKTYCLSHDWFDGGVAPYPVYDVGTDKIVPVPDLPKRCDQCAALHINRVFCHETGCPNAKKEWDGQAGEWVTPEDIYEENQ